MNEWVVSLREVEARLSEEKGEFALFAAFLPAGGADQWDLVISAPWARRDDRAVLESIRAELSRTINERASLLLGRIVVVETWHPDVQAINARRDVLHGLDTISNEEHFGYVVERGFVITSRDYWRFIKRLFPRNAQFVFFTRDGSLKVRISWHLADDPDRPHKRSRNIVLSISEEALDDYLYVDDPRRHVAEDKLALFVMERLRHFDPHHEAPAGANPPVENWRVTSEVLQRPTLAAG